MYQMEKHLRTCSHKGINNKGKKDKGQKDNIQFIIAGKNSAKAFEAAKKPFDLIALFVKRFVVVPRTFTVAFGRDHGYVAEFNSQSSSLIPFVSAIHQQVDGMLNGTNLP